MLGFVDADRGAHEAEVVLEGIFAGDLGGIGELGDGDGGEDADDDDDDENLDEAEPAAKQFLFSNHRPAPPGTRTGRSSWAALTSVSCELECAARADIGPGAFQRCKPAAQLPDEGIRRIKIFRQTQIQIRLGIGARIFFGIQ